MDPYDPDKHVWIIDRGTQLIMKFSNDGKRLVMELGEKGVAGDDAGHFGRPTDVAFLPDGTFFVSDGYDNARVVKFDRTGKYLTSWGTKGSGPGQFDVPHCIAVDAMRRVYVADRGNRRIQIFDQEGKHLATWYQFSRISGIYIDRNDTLYAIDSESDENYNPGWRKGLRVGSARTGEVWFFVPEHVSRQASGMGGVGSMGEGVAVDSAGNVYAGEVGPIQGLTKYIPRLKR
jgi:DNA-binding beta-propeller fold protein YncE